MKRTIKRTEGRFSTLVLVLDNGDRLSYELNTKQGIADFGALCVAAGKKSISAAADLIGCEIETPIINPSDYDWVA